jgi:hypothetical protein
MYYFRFLDLPAELRFCIYGLLLEIPRTVSIRVLEQTRMESQLFTLQL